MIRLIVLGVVAVSLSGCVDPQSIYEPPQVDMRGVSLDKYYKDLAECTDKKRAREFYMPNGPFISECMTQRGYNVITVKN
jgi:hypothetical protein